MNDTALAGIAETTISNRDFRMLRLKSPDHLDDPAADGILSVLFPCSSMVERAAVNRQVTGSSPVGGVQPVGLKRGRPVCLQADAGETPCYRAVAGVGRSRLCGESQGRRSERRRNGRNPALISCALWTGSQPSEIRGSIETVARSRLAAECRPRAPMKARRLARATPWHTSRRHAPNGPHFDRVFRGRRRSGTSKGAGPEPAAVGSMSGTCRTSDADIILSARFRTGSPEDRHPCAT